MHLQSEQGPVEVMMFSSAGKGLTHQQRIELPAGESKAVVGVGGTSLGTVETIFDCYSTLP